MVMSFERDKGDDFFTKFDFKRAFHSYLKSREKFYSLGKDDELRAINLKIARCLALLGRKDEALDILEEIIEQTKERALVEEHFETLLELAAINFSYGCYVEGSKHLNQVEEEEIVSESNPKIFFRYWQSKAQLMIVYRNLPEARKLVDFLMEKAKKMGNDPYFYELQVLQAQIDAEEGDVLTAYTNIEEAYKFFLSTPFERAAFEKKIMLSQFVEEPEETIRLIDEYLERYSPDDINPILFSAQRIELELRSDKITPKIATEKAERALYSSLSIEHLDLSAKIQRLLAGLYQTTGKNKEAFISFEKAQNYFISQNMEYEEAVTFFVFLPAFLHYFSTRAFGGSFHFYGAVKLPDTIEGLDIFKEMLRIENLFEKYNDPVRAKMTKFFSISHKISQQIVEKDINKSISEMEELYQWMLDRGELHYSEMIGKYLELISLHK